jgi:hypothetical protein
LPTLKKGSSKPLKTEVLIIAKTLSSLCFTGVMQMRGLSCKERSTWDKNVGIKKQKNTAID